MVINHSYEAFPFSNSMLGKSSSRRTRKSSDILDQVPLSERTKDKEKEHEKEREIVGKETGKDSTEDKKKERSRPSKQTRNESSNSSSASTSHHSSNSSSRSHKQSYQLQQRKKKGSEKQRVSWEKTAYNPPKTRQSTLKEKEDAAHLESSEQPRRSPKKNIL